MTVETAETADACWTDVPTGAGAEAVTVDAGEVAVASRMAVETGIGADAVRVTAGADAEALVPVASAPYLPVPKTLVPKMATG